MAENLDQVLSRNPKVMGGLLVFAGTRVPVTHLIEYLKAGDSLDVFLDAFRTVEREQATKVIELMGELVLAQDLVKS